MLRTDAHMAAYDDFYEALLSAHQGLSTAESHAMNARLVLLLANHIGDLAVIQEALALARNQPLPDESVSQAGCEALTPVAPSHSAS